MFGNNKNIFISICGAAIISALLIRVFTPTRNRVISLNEKPIEVEVASTYTARQKGLKDRESLPDGKGMMFVFSVSGQHGIWMKNMRFPIDVIWLKDGVIVDMAKNIQPPTQRTANEELDIYYPRMPANSIIEMSASTLDKAGVKIGDRIKGI
jgi:uncharacterized membrane protein (UPF0127 family)